MPARKNYDGKKFGRLTVLHQSGYDNSGRNRVFLCECECGEYKRVVLSALVAGLTKSCGCLNREGNHKTHGMSKIGSVTYRAWKNIRSRCNNPNNPDYHYYGGRGITVHPSWNSFEQFLRDVGEHPGGEYSIDRYPNKNGNYEPGNVRWATKSEQALNRNSSSVPQNINLALDLLNNDNLPS